MKSQNYLKRNLKKKRVKDRLSKKNRSSLMSKIRSKETKLEITFIKVLQSSTLASFEVNAKDIKGKPDIVFRKHKICLFIDSDFWHGWNYPRWKHLLKNDFWRSKIDTNRKRDRNVTRYLRRHGWKVLRLWEHRLKNDIYLKSVIKLLPKK